MRQNHVPRSVRLKARIQGLQYFLDVNHVRSGKGNPYWKCKQCGITDPALSVAGKHFKGCAVQGVEKQIKYYKDLLEEEEEVFSYQFR